VPGKHLLQISNLPVALTEVVDQRQARLFGFRFRNGSAFRLQFGGHLIVDGSQALARFSCVCPRRASRRPKSASLAASYASNCLRVSAINGAASDSVNLISVRQLGQTI
jgi:hypothetical protein